MGAFADAVAALAARPLGTDPAGRAAAQAARDRHERLAKPVGSLGRLEDLGVTLAALAGRCPPPVPAPAAVAVFAGDHGVHAQGVTPWPQAVTALMARTAAGGGAAIAVLARAVGASVTVVDVGVAADLAGAGVRDEKVRAGTRDLSTGPAMSNEECEAALDAGARVAADLVAGGAALLVTGDLGIANTTASAALVAAFTGRPAGAVTGRGTGIDDAMLATKREVVARAVARLPAGAPAAERLATLGGLEHAALAGFVVGGAAARVPVLLDGVIALAAALAAVALVPAARPALVAGHRSAEPGASVALDHLGLAPLLDLDLRLGEGTGACLAVPLVQAAARLLGEMATLEDLGLGEVGDGGDRHER